MDLTRVSRKYVEFTVTATGADGQAITLTGVDVAVLAPRATPDATTVWTAADYAAGVASVLVAGPDAPADGALPVSGRGADLWVRVTDIPEIDVARVGRITVS